jgi:hypothetical protein
MGLGAKGSAGEPWIGALGHEADPDLLGLLQIGQDQALEFAATVRIVGQVPELLQRQRQMTFADLLPKRLGSPKKTVRQVLDLPRTEFFTAQRGDKLVDGRDTV